MKKFKIEYKESFNVIGEADTISDCFRFIESHVKTKCKNSWLEGKKLVADFHPLLGYFWISRSDGEHIAYDDIPKHRYWFRENG